MILVTFLLLGCSSVQPTIVEYKISLKPIEYNSLSKRCKNNSLKVSQAFSSSSLMSSQMKYTEGDNKIYAYSQAQWSNSPSKEVSRQLVRVLRDSKLFKSVQSSKSRSKSDFILETNLDDFMQYYSDDSLKSYVKIVLNLSLIDSKINQVVAAKTFSAEMDTKTLDALGGVEGLDRALSEVLAQSVEFLNEVCK
jgi:cholesterol transport system auxiliary component